MLTLSPRNGRTLYYDAFLSGLVPVRVLGLTNDREADVVVTRTRGPYKRNEVLTDVRCDHIVYVTRRTKYHTYVTSAFVPMTEADFTNDTD